MANVIATGQPVRPPLRLSKVLFVFGAFGVLMVGLEAAHVVSVVAGMLILWGLCGAFYYAIKARVVLHHRRVVAAIKAEHAVAVPREALMELIHDRVTVFTQNGRRYRVEESEGQDEDGHWVPTTVVLVDLGADARTLFGH